MVEDFIIGQLIYQYYDIFVWSKVEMLSTFGDGSWVSKKPGAGLIVMI